MNQNSAMCVHMEFGDFRSISGFNEGEIPVTYFCSAGGTWRVLGLQK